jgi:hypothetical protein
VSKDDAEELRKEYDLLNKDVEAYNNAEENYAKASKEKWDNIGQGIAQAGQLVTGAGVAMSVFGGILSSLGLEEAGELLSQIGNFAMIAGTAISSLGPVITGIVGKLVVGGMSA